MEWSGVEFLFFMMSVLVTCSIPYLILGSTNVGILFFFFPFCFCAGSFIDRRG